MQTRRVIAQFRAGPAWGDGPPQAQPGWPAHAAFVDELVGRGTIYVGELSARP